MSIRYNVTMFDCEGDSNGGNNMSSTKQFTLQVVAVNDAPYFNLMSDTISVLEDSPFFSSQVAINISAGPANEAWQCLTFVLENCSDVLLSNFDTIPHLHANGTLVFQVAPDAAVSILYNISLMDCGGTLNGGVTSSNMKQFLLEVAAVNDAPVFRHSNVTILEDEYTNNSFASSTQIFSISKGSSHPDEQQQSLTFVISHIELDQASVQKGVALFEHRPQLSWLNASNASLSFRTLPFQFGVALVHFHLQVSRVFVNCFQSCVLKYENFNHPCTVG
jgi:hypothetical protein